MLQLYRATMLQRLGLANAPRCDEEVPGAHHPSSAVPRARKRTVAVLALLSRIRHPCAGVLACARSRATHVQLKFLTIQVSAILVAKWSTLEQRAKNHDVRVGISWVPWRSPAREGILF